MLNDPPADGQFISPPTTEDKIVSPSAETQSVSSAITLPPPSGDPQKAEDYLQKLIRLIRDDKLLVTHTDLQKIDPGSLQDHYRNDLGDYDVEVSHSKQPDTGQDHYVIIFNNLNQIKDGCAQKAVLAYLHLTEQQFQRFKEISDDQIERKRREEEERRFKEAMSPVDEAIKKLSDNFSTSAETSPPPKLSIS